jgi:hypothetical protein
MHVHDCSGLNVNDEPLFKYYKNCYDFVEHCGNVHKTAVKADSYNNLAAQKLKNIMVMLLSFEIYIILKLSSPALSF